MLSRAVKCRDALLNAKLENKSSSLAFTDHDYANDEAAGGKDDLPGADKELLEDLLFRK